MTEVAAPAPETVAQPIPRRTLREWLTRNPVALKELRGRMRGARAFVVLSIYLLLMSGFVTLLYTVYSLSTSSVYNAPDRQLLGKFVFGAVVAVELMMVCFIAPAFTVGAISGERERQTYDLLRTTLLPARSLVLGKLLSALFYIFLLLLAALPLQSLAFLLGGVAPEEVLIAMLLLVATGFLFGAAGIFFSSLMRRTLGATVLTYAFALLANLGLPVLLVVLIPILGILNYAATPPLVIQGLLLYGFGVLVATNPVATIVATETILINEHTILFFSLPLTPVSGTSISVPLISPWIPFTLFYLGLGVVLIVIAIGLVRRVER